MRLVLDTNIYVFAFSEAEIPSCVRLLEAASIANASIHVARTIIREVQDNLRPILFKEFILFIHKAAHLEEDNVVPFLSRQPNLPFKVLTAEKCLKFLK